MHQIGTKKEPDELEAHPALRKRNASGIPARLSGEKTLIAAGAPDVNGNATQPRQGEFHEYINQRFYE